MPIDQSQPAFVPLSAACAPQIIAYARAASGRLCDKTAGNLFMWARQNETHYARFAGMDLLRSRWDGRLIYACPSGDGDFAAAIEAIAADAQAHGEPLVFASLTAEEADRIAALRGGTRRTDLAWSDYLYPADALAALAGRAYHGPRNHINSFLSAYPEHTVSPLTQDDLPAVGAFFAEQRIAADDGTPSAAAEAEAAADMLDLYPALRDAGAPLCGCVLRIDGEIAGFSIGEVLGDTLYVHIEKGNPACRGVYPMLVREFARMGLAAGASLINREEDDGNPGLRRSKQAYRPSALLDKYMLLCP